MNQEEEIPTRVTRGALRRRSVDQEATPQKAIGTVTAGGTPKKGTSAAKKPTALNVIQESDGAKPASPGSGRNTRRRASESVDTPTTVGKTNKTVQALKESEKSDGTGGRSRNSSLSEENVKAFNAGLEDVGHLTRSRTPVRLRPSQETFTSTPQSVPAAVRRSARRNSVTSDDGGASVQSLPISTSKVAGALRTRKDDTIIEEETGNEGSVSSENSRRSSNARLNSPQITVDSPSPQKRDLEKGALSRGASKSPRFGSSLRLSNASPRSKNVSFSELSQPENNQSSYPKTPITTDKRMVLLLTDLRDTSLLTREPKVNDIITIPRKHQEITGAKMNVDQNTSDGKVNKEKANLAVISDPVVPQSERDDNESSAGTTIRNNMVAERATEDRNEISGVEALDSSLPAVQSTENTKNSDSYSNAWCQSVCGSSTKGIDGFSVQKQEAEKQLMKQQEEMSAKPTRSSLKGDTNRHQTTTTIDTTDEDEAEQEEDEEENTSKSFIDNEAIEMECYQSGDSLDDETRREMEENEIPEHGEDLGSEDTEEGIDQEESDEKDSFVVSDDDIDEELEIELLEGTDEASSIADDSPKKAHEDAHPKTSPKIDAEVNSPLAGSPVVVGSPKLQEEVALEQSVPNEESVVVSAVQELVKDHSTCTPDTLDVEAAVVRSPKLTKDRTTIASRKSLPDPITITITSKSSVHMFGNTLRKSLPVGVKDRSLEEKGGKLTDLNHSVESCSGNNAGENNKSNKSPDITVAEDVNDTMASHQQPAEEFDHKTIGAGDKITDEVTPKKDFIDKKEHPKKSMPNATLVSSLFYLGGAKKATRNNTTGGDDTGGTSVPQQMDVKKSKRPGAMLANPFATDKSTTRRSTGSLGGPKKKIKAENSRGSLPAKLNEDDAKEKLIENVDKTSNATQLQPESQSLELGDGGDAVHRVPDAVNSGNAEDSGEKEKIKTMKVTKPLEAYDLDSILSRCNEVVRANKERKKVNATALQKKKDEKKLRREQKPNIGPKDVTGGAQEDDNKQHSSHMMPDDEADDTNNKSVSTGNDSTEQHSLNEAKKKKKRKQKVKNYLLDELSAIKKDSVARALQHKLEQIKIRKQAKKERREARQNLLNKENGNSTGTKTNTEGIKAKLEKAKRNQLKETNAKKLESNSQQVPGATEKKLKIRAAVSAFAVFQGDNPRSMTTFMENNETNVRRVPSGQEKQEDSPHLIKEETYVSKKPTVSEELTDIRDSSKQDIKSKPKTKGSLADTRPTKMKRHVPENESIDSTVNRELQKQLRRQKESKNDGAEVERTSHLAKPKVKRSVQKKVNGNQECNEKALAGSEDSVKKLLKNDKKIGGTQSLVSVVSTALTAFNQTMVANSLKEKKKSKPLRDNHQRQTDSEADDITKLKRKRFSEESTSPTPSQPAKLPKLKALQRLAQGFVEQTVTPEKERMKRNFGFVECQATPKAIGFKVQSVLPTEAEELRVLQGDGSKKTTGGRKKKGKSGTSLATQSNRSLPLPIWTSSGFFIEDDIGTDKTIASKRGRKANASVTDSSSSYKNVKGHRGFKLKTLREPSNGTAENPPTKPYLIDSAIVPDSVVNFKRQQLLEKTTHLREKQKKVGSV
ncbi:E3 ubiquitin-protein ligase RBBP6 [Anopheles cruzii]|uniref:E3 ubiquitin-protein ligase RBBP6 n=1 Tax=Anopheles cruzii TaxID=68878 RepID=UPI0022EC83FC|nr:E3 ubiquitin-protein ligase RBBP6 [Anopheles cruzii]